MAIASDHVDHEIAWREAGNGDPIVFLHGLGGTRMAWEAQLTDLGDHYRCLAWDMPGYGGSRPVVPLTFEAIADAVARLLDLVEIDKAHLCGLSFGGQHAQHVALRHPDRVNGLILVDTSPAFGLDGTDPDEWRASRLDAIDAGLTPAQIAADVISSIAAPGFSGPEYDRAVAAFASIDPAGFRAACDCLVTHDVRDRLGHIDVPALVVFGELDFETPAAYSRLIADLIGESELFEIAGAGHLVPSEAPEILNALIRRFMATTTVLG